MMSEETLAFVALGAWLVLFGMGIVYQLATDWPSRPMPYLLVGSVLEIAAIWLALKVVL